MACRRIGVWIVDMNLKITSLKLQPHLLEANDMNSCKVRGPVVTRKTDYFAHIGLCGFFSTGNKFFNVKAIDIQSNRPGAPFTNMDKL